MLAHNDVPADILNYFESAGCGSCYVCTMVEVFREVRRVLHDSGTLFLNLGDSYNNRTRVRPSSHQPSLNGVVDESWRERAANGGCRMSTNDGDLKEKDLHGIPWAVAFALRADGWYLRSAMPWIKRACMPESATDRPTTAIEYVFLFSKRARYFWDQEAVKRGDAVHARKGVAVGRNTNVSAKRPGWADHNGFNRDIETVGRNFRNSDPWFDSLDALIAAERSYLADLEAMRERGGLLLDEGGDPLALDINPAAFKEAHFATFPPALVEPMIRSGTSECGVCPTCADPWRRMVERTAMVIRPGPRSGRYGSNTTDGLTGTMLKPATAMTTGWEPTCTCGGDPVPATILDPFVGSGTTLMVADRLGRHGIGVELNESYAALALKRITDDAPMFAAVEVEPALPLFAAAGLELP